MLKINTRAFTLVELMIVIAIIGVLAAALFPMMRGYLEKSRDTARISHLGQLRTVVQSFLQDTGHQPFIGTGWSDYCVGDPATGSGGEIAANLNGGMVPLDPVNGRTVDPCSQTGATSTRIVGRGLYGYLTGDTASSNKAFMLATRVESSQSSTTGAAALGTGTAQIDALFLIHGQKGLAPSLPTQANNGGGDYGVYVLGGMN